MNMWLWDQALWDQALWDCAVWDRARALRVTQIGAASLALRRGRPRGERQCRFVRVGTREGGQVGMRLVVDRQQRAEAVQHQGDRAGQVALRVDRPAAQDTPARRQ